MSVERNNKIKIFSAGCKICNGVENQVRKIIEETDTLIVYNLSDEKHSSEYYKTAESYGINSVPSVVVNGKLLGCCNSGGFDKTVLLNSLN
ncbi:MAG: thioredoxin family protein [Bacteroidetes bacterium]|nr:thioredoxin family protein [Bacteroidota bacterium]